MLRSIIELSLLEAEFCLSACMTSTFQEVPPAPVVCDCTLSNRRGRRAPLRSSWRTFACRAGMVVGNFYRHLLHPLEKSCILLATSSACRFTLFFCWPGLWRNYRGDDDGPDRQTDMSQRALTWPQIQSETWNSVPQFFQMYFHFVSCVFMRPHVDRTAEGDKVKARLVQQAICNSLRLTHATI